MKYLFLLFILIQNCFSQTILIDPGHGGEDNGATSLFKGTQIHEKDLALSISKKIFKKLKKKGYQVYLTRSIDREVALEKRAELAEKVRLAVAEMIVEVGENTQISFTVSIGVSCLQQGDSEASMMTRADEALYQAKNIGRNRVIFAD